MKQTNIEPQLIPLKDLIKEWKKIKEWFSKFKKK
jgi:hypothetical protein